MSKKSNSSVNFSYKNKQWFVINWESGLKRIHEILKAYPISGQNDSDVFLTFGYKILSPGDKETFYLLKDLASLNEKKNKKYQCQASLEFLAEVLDTKIFCQSRRIKKLSKAGLISVIRRGGGYAQANIYIPVKKVLPDSTLIDKLIILIRRKELIENIRLYESLNNDEILGREVLEKIKKIIKKIPQYEHLLDKNIKNSLSINTNK